MFDTIMKSGKLISIGMCFVIAGVSVVLSLLKQTSVEKGSDVDLFFLKNDSQLFEQAAVRNLFFHLYCTDLQKYINIFTPIIKTCTWEKLENKIQGFHLEKRH